MDAFGIENHGYSPLISQKYVVKGDFEVYDGMDLLHHAMLNTLPNINKDGGKENLEAVAFLHVLQDGTHTSQRKPTNHQHESLATYHRT